MEMNFGLLRVNHRTSKFCIEPALLELYGSQSSLLVHSVTQQASAAHLLRDRHFWGLDTHQRRRRRTAVPSRCCQAWHRRHCLEGVLYVKACGTSPVAQWLWLRAPNAEDPGSIPGKGTFQIRSHTPQLRVCTPQPEILCARTKARYSQINRHVI